MQTWVFFWSYFLFQYRNISESIQLFNISAASCANAYLESCGRFVARLTFCDKASLPSWTSDRSRFVNYLVKLGTRSGSWKKQSVPPERPQMKAKKWEGSWAGRGVLVASSFGSVYTAACHWGTLLGAGMGGRDWVGRERCLFLIGSIRNSFHVFIAENEGNMWTRRKERRRGVRCLVVLNGSVALDVRWSGRDMVVVGTGGRRGCSPHGDQAAGLGRMNKIEASRHVPSDLLSSVRSHLLEIHRFPIMAPNLI